MKLFQEHPFIKRHEELEVDVAGYVSNILDQMQDISSDDLIASSSSWQSHTFSHQFRDYQLGRWPTAAGSNVFYVGIYFDLRHHGIVWIDMTGFTVDKLLYLLKNFIVFTLYNYIPVDKHESR